MQESKFLLGTPLLELEKKYIGTPVQSPEQLNYSSNLLKKNNVWLS
jgi:hypothetical protein